MTPAEIKSAARVDEGARWQSMADRFIRSTQIRSAHNTFYNYKTQVNQFVRWVVAAGVPVGEFTGEDLDAYLAHKKGLGISETTVRQYAVNVKIFFKWCVKKKLLASNPLTEYDLPRKVEPYRKSLTKPELVRLLLALHERWVPAHNDRIECIPVSRRTVYQKRNVTIVTLMACTGCRPSEVLALTLDDYQPDHTAVDQDTGIERPAPRVVVRQAKGRTGRPVPISREVIPVMDAWIAFRESLGLESDLIFTTCTDGLIRVNSFCRAFRQYVAFAGLPPEVTMRCLRRYAGSRLAGKDFWAAVKVLGHKDPRTTVMYLRMDDSHTAEAHESADLLGGVLDGLPVQKMKKPRKF
jgi:site-specific recombinase XerD